jgi:hypothetical protein
MIYYPALAVKLMHVIEAATKATFGVSSECRWRVMPQAQWLQTIWRIQPSSEA